MSRPASILVLVLAALPCACGDGAKGHHVRTPHDERSAASANEPDYTWPVPTGWRSELIAFPLGFAPEIAHRGVEEVRLMPGFADANAPDWWSGAFMWWIDDARPADAATLGEDLTAYYRGLMRAVAQDKGRTVDTNAIRAEIAPSGARLSGTARLVDAFGAGDPVTLRLEIRVVDAGTRRAVLVAFSPRAAEHAVWRDIESLLDSLKTRAAVR